jgi:predicted O-methyltransferase YrrM
MDITAINTDLLNELTQYLTHPDNINEYKNEFECAYHCFFEAPGKNHYHLFANISKQINNATIFDLGTYRGLSALAWAYNKTNTVHTFDVEYDYAGRHNTVYQDQTIIKKDNIIQHIQNIFTEDINDNIKELILKSNIIFMDAGDHLSQKLEFFLINFLRKNNYQGLVIWDDIYLNDDMIGVWNSIPNDEKVDITKYGHFSGTGLWTMNKHLFESISI